MTKITIMGAGGHARVVADAILAGGAHEIGGFLDDDPSLWGRRIFERPVSGPIDAWRSGPEDGFVVGLGENAARKRCFELFRSTGAVPVTVLHPRATVAQGVRLGLGTVILAGAIINCDTQVGDNCILNTASTVDHDSSVEAHAHVGPGAHIAGGVRLCEGAFVGAGAILVPGVQLGQWSVVGAGAVVIRGIDPGQVVAGNPARPIR